jgi:hypothetical protein
MGGLTAVRGGGFSVVTFETLPQGLLIVYGTYIPEAMTGTDSLLTGIKIVLMMVRIYIR